MMIKVALFTEGQSELIFSRNLLRLLFDPTCLSFECIKLVGNKQEPIPFSFYPPNPKCHFLIVNVQGDGRLISYLVDRIDSLVEKHDLIIGLRDVYSKEYEEFSNTLDQSTIDQFINLQKRIVLGKTENPHRVKLHYAIMEFEAWILSMPYLLECFNHSLTCEYILNHLGIDLETLNPQTELLHPANELSRILELVNVKYRKNWDDIESITCHLSEELLNQLIDKWKSPSFNSFYFEIENIMNAGCNT